MRVNVCSETGDWILPKCARTIVEAATGTDVDVRWNGNWHADPDAVHGVNYGYLERTPGFATARIRTAQFGHLNPGVIADVYRRVAELATVCVAVSVGSRDDLLGIGVPAERVVVIEHGVDPEHTPRLVLGFVGRNYAPRTGGVDDRKGVGLLRAFLADPWVAANVHVRIMGEGWGDLPGSVEVLPFDMARLPAFYDCCDYLLCTSSIEGGPMPLIEGLAHGKLMVIPPMGYAINYPAIHYENSSLPSLIAVVSSLADAKLCQIQARRDYVAGLTWSAWARAHLRLWRSLASG